MTADTPGIYLLPLQSVVPLEDTPPQKAAQLGATAQDGGGLLQESELKGGGEGNQKQRQSLTKSREGLNHSLKLFCRGQRVSQGRSRAIFQEG